MRIANLAGRLVLVTDSGAVDVEEASQGRFGSDPTAVYRDWAAFVAWASSAQLPPGTPYDEARLGAPVPESGQVFAIGLNYKGHALESGITDFPVEPPVFTKFRSSITGPYGELELPTATVDWEAELVVVIGREARHVGAADAWDHVAGLTIAQDYSDRTRQLVPPVPQFCFSVAASSRSSSSFSGSSVTVVTPCPRRPAVSRPTFTVGSLRGGAGFAG